MLLYRAQGYPNVHSVKFEKLRCYGQVDGRNKLKNNHRQKEKLIKTRKTQRRVFQETKEHVALSDAKGYGKSNREGSIDYTETTEKTDESQTGGS